MGAKAPKPPQGVKPLGRRRLLTGGLAHLARWRYFYALLCSAAIFALSSFSLNLPPQAGSYDKGLHIIAYFGLGLTYQNAFTNGFELATPLRIGLAWLATIAYGISDEWHQSFVPGRFPESADVLADSLGGLLAVGFGLWLARIFHEQSSRKR